MRFLSLITNKTQIQTICLGKSHKIRLLLTEKVFVLNINKNKHKTVFFILIKCFYIYLFKRRYLPLKSSLFVFVGSNPSMYLIGLIVKKLASSSAMISFSLSGWPKIICERGTMPSQIYLAYFHHLFQTKLLQDPQFQYLDQNH